MALADEIVPGGPEMSPVRMAFLLPRSREWLAGARACPNRSVSPASELEGVGPASDAGEEVGLRVVAHIIRRDLLNRPLVYVARRQMSCRDQIAEPCADEGLGVVVV